MKLGTHNGVFHADDVLAVAIIKMVIASLQVVRTRDSEILATCDVVVDVGGIHDPTTNRFDHHQRGRAGERSNGVLYSAAGLVWWSEWGLKACEGDEEIRALVDESLVQGVCAQDNGQELEVGGEPAFKRQDGTPVFLKSFSSTLSLLNPSWHEGGDFDKAFNEAVEVAGVFLRREIARAKGVAKAKELTEAALGRREDPRVLVLGSFHPWQREAVEDQDVLLAIFPSETGEWMIQCVPPTLGSFEKRLPLPEAWAGLRGDDLAQKINLPGAIFCHPGRFIAGHKTREGALAMAHLALSA